MLPVMHGYVCRCVKDVDVNSQLQYKRIQEHVNKTSVKQKH